MGTCPLCSTINLAASRSLQAEEQQLLMKQPAAPQRLAQVKEWLQERQVALEQQRRLLDEKQLVRTLISSWYDHELIKP